MRIKRYFFLCLGLHSLCVAKPMPDFSWETVPRYMHVRKVTAFTPAEIKYLAEFPLITFEKTTGMRDSNGTEAGTTKAARAVKRINPRSKILFYRNIIVHYSMYAADADLPKMRDPFLADRTGNTKLIRNSVPAYDLTNRDVRDWWMELSAQVCGSEYIDGLFVDGSIKVLEPGFLRSQIGQKKKDAVTETYHKMMAALPRELGSDKLVLANIIRARLPDSGLECMDYFDGSYIENFERTVAGISREDYMAKGIAAIQAAARNGKIIAFTMGMDWPDKKERKGKQDTRERFLYALALFLICAEEHSYFMAKDGYGVDSGKREFWMDSIPEYAYPLGAPKGPAVKKGSVYRREFEHAKVVVDIGRETGNIVWLNRDKGK